MTLKELLARVPGVNWGEAAERKVTTLCFDSRLLEAGCVFVAVRGGRHDGHDFLSEAAAQGALALIVEDAARVPKEFGGAVAVVRDSRQVLNQLASVWNGEPARSLFCAGVTGTNGKTTTTYLIEAVLTAHGMKTGVIGTINHHIGDRIWNTEMTTPDPLSFQTRLREFKELGARAVAMEVSSHALKQSRVDEVPFDAAVFTNLTRDHLDYHPDMEDYFQAKNRLFGDLLSRSIKAGRVALVNAQDEWSKRIAVSGGAKVWTYGLESGGSARPDLAFRVLSQDFSGMRFHLRTPAGEREFSVPMTGLHNVYNAAGAIGVGLAAGAALETCAQALERFRGVPGRLESVANDRGIHVFVDYAHTDDALRGVLATLNKVRREAGIANRLITVFGCGGDRDKGKRPLMMKAAAEGSDLVVVTSDNPRTEDPEAIIDDAVAGADSSLLGTRVLREADRRKAIALAVAQAKPGDVILIAGKGHETYQQIGTRKFPFSDVDVVKESLK